MDELISTQLHHAFCSDVCSPLNDGEGLPFELDENGLLVRTATTDQQIVIPHVAQRL